LLSKEMTSSASDAASNQSRGQNALQRRALQLKRWTEWTQSEAEKAPKGGPQATPKVQFSSATLFLSAVAQNDVNECERLLRTTRDLNVNVTTGDGLTALHQMAIDDNLAMCRWLLDNGADANCKDNEGWTPLHASARYAMTATPCRLSSSRLPPVVLSCGHVEVVRLLLSRDDIDVFAINCDGELARDVCDGEQCLHAIEERMVAELRQRDDKTTLATTDDDSLIGEQVLRDLRNKELKQIERDFEAFLRETSAPSEHDFRAFLERTRDPASRATIVHVCAAKGYNECLCRVLEALAATECATDALLDSLRDSDGFTALHASAFWQQTHALETLLRFGASIDLKTADARELLDLCHENPKVAELLSETRRARAENADKPLKASETQRKLNAKRQRETRRPTQGVSKEDIELALKTTPSGMTTRVVSVVSHVVSLSVLADDDCMTTATTDDTIETTTPPPMPSSPPPSAPSPPSDSAAAPEVPNGGQPTAPHAARRRPKRRSTGIEENLELNDLRGEPLAPSLGVDNDCTDSSVSFAKTLLLIEAKRETTP
jgi:ankyrin repeat protein